MTTTLEAPEETTPGLHNKQLMEPGDTVARRIAKYPMEAQATLLWFDHFLRSKKWGYKDARNLLMQPGRGNKPYSEDSIYQLMTGRRDAKDIAPMLAAIGAFKAIEERRAGATRAPFIETSLSARIAQVCNAARTNQRVVFIEGESQIGKTAALEEYQRRNNHGHTIYVRMPEGGGISDFGHVLAAKCGIAFENSGGVRRRLASYFNSSMVLIIDELHQCFLPVERPNSWRPLEFIREIFDASQCGVVLCATRLLGTMLAKGHYKEIATQLQRRSLGHPLILESQPLRADLEKFAAHYGLEPARAGTEEGDLQHAVTRDAGMGQWITYLTIGARLANEAKEAVAWEHVLRAEAMVQSLRTPPREAH